MKTFKNLLTLILAMAVLSTSFVPVYADTESDKTPEEIAFIERFNENRNLLMAIGILDDSSIDDETIELARYDLAHVLSEGLYGELTYTKGQIYTDVSREEECFNDVGKMYELGLMLGTEKAYFDLVAPASTDTIAIVLLRALGYDDSLISKAAGQREKLYRDVEPAEYATYADLYQMLVNFLEAKPIVFDYISKNGSLQRSRSGDEYMNIVYDIYREEGRLLDNGYTSLFSDRESESDTIVIDDTEYTAPGIDVYDLIGKNVEVYYKQYNEFSPKQVVYIRSKDDSNKSLTLTSDMKVAFDDWTISYVENNRNKTVKLKDTSDIIYNGKVLKNAEFDPALFNIKNGSVTLLNGGSGYDVAIIKSYIDAYVKSVVDREDKYAIYDTMTEMEVLDYDPSASDTNMRIKKDGAIATKKDIKADTVVSIARSMDGKLNEVIVGTAKYVGMINSFIENASGLGVEMKMFDNTSLDFDTESYDISDEFVAYAEGKSILETNVKVTYFLNAAGQIAYLTKYDDNASFYAYVIGIASSESKLNPKLTFKVFKSNDGKVALFDLADKPVIDGDRYKSTDIDVINKKFYKYKDGSFCPDITYITLNNEGQIMELDTLDKGPNESDNSLRELHQINESYSPSGFTGSFLTNGFVYRPNRFKNNLYFNSKTKIMGIPMAEDIAEDSDYMILASGFSNDRYYYARGFTRDIEEEVSEVLLWYTGLTKYVPELDARMNYRRYYSDGTVEKIYSPQISLPLAHYSDFSFSLVRRASKYEDETLGDMCRLTTFTMKGSETTCEVEQDSMLKDVKNGDMIFYSKKNNHNYAEPFFNIDEEKFIETANPLSLNEAGTPTACMYNIEPVYRQAMSINLNTTTAYDGGALRVVYAKPIKKTTKKLLYYAPVAAVDNGTVDESNTYNTLINNKNIYLIKRTPKGYTTYQVDYNEIRDSITYPGSESKILIQTLFNDFVAMYIIED